MGLALALVLVLVPALAIGPGSTPSAADRVANELLLDLCNYIFIYITKFIFIPRSLQGRVGIKVGSESVASSSHCPQSHRLGPQ